MDEYVASAWGNEFHNLRCWEALGAGSAGPGKSLVLLMDPIIRYAIEEQRRCVDKSHQHPLRIGGSSGVALHLRRLLPTLQTTMNRAAKLFPRIDPKVKWKASTYTWTFQSGFQYRFGHCKDIDSWDQFMSEEFCWIGFDELSQFDEEQYTNIRGRVRSTDPVLVDKLAVRAMSNPYYKREASAGKVRDPHWVRRRFVDPAPEGRRLLVTEVTMADGTTECLDRIYLPAKLSDNPDPVFRRVYEKNLRTMPAHIQKALLEGDWYVTPGSFFGEDWIKGVHTRPPFRIPESWSRFRSMDWGYKSPGCIHWWAIDPDDNLYCVEEFTFQGQSDVDVAKVVQDIERRLGLWSGKRSGISGPADTQIWEQRGNAGKSIAQNFLSKGVNWVRADKRSRATNAQRMLSRLKDYDHNGGTPGIVFFDNCREAIRTIPAIVADANNPETPTDGGPDHWLDSALYACAYASRGRAGVPSVRRRGTDDEEESDGPGARRMGRFGYGSGVL